MACGDTLANIEKICGSSIASGFKKTVYVALEEDVDTIAAPGTGTHTISTNITMEATKTFYEWSVTDLDQEFTVKPEGDAPFNTLVTTLKFRVPKTNATTSYILNGLQGGAFIVIPEDLTGQKRIIGGTNDGATFSFEESVTDKNSYIVTFTWKSSLDPYFYTGTIAL